ncbi:helix-turn-helix domain-containing protein [Streptomyces sp. NPDC127051]|uniref:helix-turn-helix domain-containing protein n=1 Tax=Streptomyces sp. NPDC127051 TaxID=3347119 RepID=UPI00365FD7B3
MVLAELDETVRERLIRTAGSLKAQVRARIVLAAAAGLDNEAIARDLAVGVNMVRKRRGRFAAKGLEGFKDAAASRAGRPKTYGPLVRTAVVAAATSAPPHRTSAARSRLASRRRR